MVPALERSLDSGFVRPADSDPASIVMTFPVAREFSGQRIDVFIQSRIPRLSRTRAQAIVKLSAYSLDGNKRRAGDRVREGETVVLLRPPFPEPDAPRVFGVVHEDEFVLGVDKPSGLPVHPTATYHNNTLTKLLEEKYGRPTPHIAHRLDKETSGLILCAKTLEVERALKRLFVQREVKKMYLAIVRGDIADEGEIDVPLSPVEQGLHLLMEVRDSGESSRAVTHFRVLERKPGYAKVGLWPHTGRQHQLRVHLTHLGYPILGDKLYGPEREQIFLDCIETGMTPELEKRAGHWRHALHAHEATFRHPTTGEELTLRAPLPTDLEKLWSSLPE